MFVTWLSELFDPPLNTLARSAPLAPGKIQYIYLTLDNEYFRAYFPASRWAEIRENLLSIHSQLKMGTVDDFSIFMSAVIDEASFNRVSGYIEAAKADPNCEIIAGGGYDKSKGFFVEPTIILTKDPKCLTMQEEIFGPVLTVYVYEDDKMDETIEIMKDTSSKFLRSRQCLIDMFSLRSYWCYLLRKRISCSRIDDETSTNCRKLLYQ